jgi:hypothetical protein
MVADIRVLHVLLELFNMRKMIYLFICSLDIHSNGKWVQELY